MLATVSSRLPEIISTLKVLKNVVALAPLGEQVGAGIELAISICEMAQACAMIALVSHMLMHARCVERES
jgi:hypothetical protein